MQIWYGGKTPHIYNVTLDGGEWSVLGFLQDIPQYPLAGGLVDVRAGLDAVADHTNPSVMPRLRMNEATLHFLHTPSRHALGELYFNLY
jgi:hypothetical protein